MNQRGRSSLATHPAVFSNFLNGADPAAQARQLSRAHGCTYMASLLKVTASSEMLSCQGHLLPL